MNKEKIENLVSENMDDLEETLNSKLKKLLFDVGIKDQDSLIFAREVFFRG